MIERFPGIQHVSIVCLLLGMFLVPLEGVEIFVSPTGDDTNTGTIEKPFRTIQIAISRLKPGDILYIRSGRYNEEVSLDSLNGTPDSPIGIRGYQGEQAVLDGSEVISGPWEKHDGKIYKTVLAKDIWQLFVDDEMATPARWPNAHLSDAWNMKATWRHMSPESEFGRAIDERPFQEMTRRRDEKTYSPLPNGVNEESLAETGLDVTGSVAIMNLGSWLTWAQRVSSHSPGSATFTYDTDFAGSGRAMARAAQRFSGNEDFWLRKNVRVEQAHYYLEGKLELLDSPGEWFYDVISKTLYLWSPDGGDPSSSVVRGKTQTYLLKAVRSSHIAIQNLEFFGGTFQFVDCSNMLVEDCHFRYPSQSKLMLGDFQRAEVTTMTSTVRGGDRLPEKSFSNVIRNCVFEHIDGPGFEIAGMNDRVENCLFAYVDNTCLGTGGGGSLNAGNSVGLTFRRNTVHTAGNSEGFRSGKSTLIELNRISNMGLMQHDGSAINVGLQRQNGTVVRHNWSHDNNRGGIRFDAVSSSTNYGSNGTIHHNVVWKSHRIAVKGDRHRVFNNTAFDNDTYDIGVLDHAPMGGINKETITRNNLAGSFSGKFWMPYPVPGTFDHNWSGEVREVLRDPDNLDFRPKLSSPVIDAGAAIDDLVEIVDGGGSEIGAYEAGAENYWIPGRKTLAASTPVPPDGAMKVKADADLMWLEGYRATGHEVYFGADRGVVESADRNSELYQGVHRNNVYELDPLVSGKTYYWRVDAVNGEERARGAIWAFTVDE